MIQELNGAFGECKTTAEVVARNDKFLSDPAFVKDTLSPFAAAVFDFTPEFFKKELLVARQMQGFIHPSMIATEKLINHYLTEEMKFRSKKRGKKIPFAGITHYFGFQGRGSLPSCLDCNLSSTYGFTAGVLIQNGFTGLVTTAKGVFNPPCDWRVGGVPGISMMSCKDSSKFGKNTLMIPSAKVDLNSGVFNRLRALREEWEIDEKYRNPGPLQLFGAGKDLVNKTLYYSYGNYSNMLKDV